MSDESADALIRGLEARGLKIRGRVPSDYKPTEILLQILAERGLRIGDPAVARHYLDTVGYYRLSGFYPFFYEDEKKFDGNIPASIEDIFHLYSFDRRLRLLLMGPLEKIEVALRALIIKEVGDYLSRTKGDPTVIDLFDTSLYDLPGKRVHGEKITNNESMFKLAKDSLQDGARAQWNARFPSAKSVNPNLTRTEWRGAFPAFYKTMPAWAALQSSSFGPLVYLYALLRSEIAFPISEKFRLPRRVLKPALFALKELRNSCAHHEPIWSWDAQSRSVELPFPNRYVDAAGITEANKLRLYPHCALVHILLSFLSNGHSTWHRRLKKLVNEFNTMYSSSMGFPEHWQTMPFWCVSNVEGTAQYERLRSRVHGTSVPA